MCPRNQKEKNVQHEAWNDKKEDQLGGYGWPKCLVRGNICLDVRKTFNTAMLENEVSETREICRIDRRMRLACVPS